jgi:hypothetical protein
MFSRTVCNLTLVVLTSLSSRCFSQAETQATASQLVSNLADSKFEVRERATRDLLQLGPEIIEDLKRLTNTGLPKEAQVRASSILSELERKKLAGLAQAFLADANEKNAHGLPGWHTFRQHVGGSRVAKQLFLDAIHSQYDVMALIDDVHGQRLSSQNTQATESKLAELTAIKSNMLLEQLHRDGRLEMGDSMAMLLAVASVDQAASYEVSQYIRSCADLRFSGNLNRQGVRNCILSLLGSWIPKSPESMAPDVLRIGRELDQPAVLPIARQHLSKSFDPFTREQAIMCLCKYGEARDAERLLKYVEDTTIIDKYLDLVGDDDAIMESRVAPPGFNSPSINIPQKLIRVNDLAVIVAMRLLREDPSQIFANYKAERFMIGWRAAVAVPESDQLQRDEAIAAWLAATNRNAAPAAGSPLAIPVPDPKP